MIAVSLFRGARCKTPIRREVTPARLAEVLTRAEYRPGRTKTDLWAWSPTVYVEGATRAAANVKQITAAVFDVDDGLLTVRELFDAWPGVSRIVHSSWSHRVEHPKGRLVVLLGSPIPIEHWVRARIRLWTLARRRGISPDRAASDASRMYFLPALRAPDAPFAAYTDLESPPLAVDWAALPDPREALAQLRREMPRPRLGSQLDSPDLVQRRMAGLVRTTVSRLAELGPGDGRYDALFDAAHSLAGHAAHYGHDMAPIRGALESAARECGGGGTSVRDGLRAVSAGLELGATRPWPLSDGRAA